MGRSRAQLDVTLKFLLDHGNIQPGNGVLLVSTRDQSRLADLNPDGTIAFEGVRHRSLSSFAVAAIRSCGAVWRKTANGWQVVHYHGRPLEQYRAEFLERQNQECSSGTSGDVGPKKRRILCSSAEDGMAKSIVYWPSGAAEVDEILRRDDSGGSLSSSTDATPRPSSCKPLPWTKTFTQKRVRPSRTWFDTLRQREITKNVTHATILKRNNTTTTALTEKSEMHQQAIEIMDGTSRDKESCRNRSCKEEDDDDEQTLAVNMWLKKALAKRHREECGLS